MKAFDNVVGVRFSQTDLDAERSARGRFLKEESINLREWGEYYQSVWGVELNTSFGETDEGEQWFTISQEKRDCEELLASVFLVKNDSGSSAWNYYCGPRDTYYEADTLKEVMKRQMPDGMFEKLIEKHTTWGKRENVIQFV